MEGAGATCSDLNGCVPIYSTIHRVTEVHFTIYILLISSKTLGESPPLRRAHSVTLADGKAIIHSGGIYLSNVYILDTINGRSQRTTFPYGV
jgi:hypothetical protein